MNYDKQNVDWALFKIDENFKVIDISKTLVTANDTDEAKKIHNERGYDRIPIREKDQINKYYDSSLNTTNEIKRAELVSSDVGILQTLSLLSRRDFYFILNGSEITHIVHYSDLNSPLVLIGLYAQIAYCELAIRDFARLKNGNNTERGIEKFLKAVNSHITGKKIDIERAKKQFSDKKKIQAETDEFDELYFDEELIMFRELCKSIPSIDQFSNLKGSVNLDDSVIRRFENLRNDIMHSKPQVIKQKSDVAKWLEFLNSCQTIIRIIDGKAMS